MQNKKNQRWDLHASYLHRPAHVTTTVHTCDEGKNNSYTSMSGSRMVRPFIAASLACHLHLHLYYLGTRQITNPPICMYVSLSDVTSFCNFGWVTKGLFDFQGLEPRIDFNRIISLIYIRGVWFEKSLHPK
jgi:hypothetical protein